jgi:GAF domain-containing protein
MAAAQALEDVMEEALDQDCEIVVPAPAHSTAVARSHVQYAHTQGAGHLLSLPLRVGGQALAVLTAERRSGEFDDAQRWEMRLICELVASRLATLQQQERWVGARWADAARTGLGRLWGVEHSLAKLAVLCAVAVGARVIAVDVNAPARAKAEALGAVASIDATLGAELVRQAVLEMTDGIGAGAISLD